MMGSVFYLCRNYSVVLPKPIVLHSGWSLIHTASVRRKILYEIMLIKCIDLCVIWKTSLHQILKKEC